MKNYIDTTKDYVTIYDRKTDSVFSHTAPINFISSEFLRDFNTLTQPVTPFNYEFKKSGFSVDVTEGTLLPVNIKSNVFNIFFFICENLPKKANILLGNDFLISINGRWDNHNINNIILN